METIIYLIEHPSEKFTGNLGAVDFYQGRGSTSSKEDAQKLARLGYLVTEQGTGAAVEPTPAPAAIPWTSVNKKDAERQREQLRRFGK